MKEVFQERRWDWGKISFELPHMVTNKIRAIPMQLFGEKEDSLIWNIWKDGGLNTASAYDLARPDLANSHPFMGSWIWKLETLPKIIHFI